MSYTYTTGFSSDHDISMLITIDYVIDAYVDPETGVISGGTSWSYMVYDNVGNLVNSHDGVGDRAGFSYLYHHLDENVGVFQYKISFSAVNPASAEGFVLNFTLFDGALEAGDLSIAGTESEDFILGGFGADYIRSWGGNDRIDAGAGNDVVTAGGGTDELDGGVGDDILIGGGGNDRYTVDSANDLTFESLDQGLDSVYCSVSFTLQDNIERLYLTGFSAIDATGNALDNRLNGNAGDNVLDGRAGADELIGFGGNDTFIVDHVGDRVVEQFGRGSGTDTVRSSVSYTLSLNVENLVLTGSANLNAIGNGSANVLSGNAGANRLDGGAGGDTMTGGAGNDTYIVDNASDQVIEAASGGRDAVATSVSYALAAGQEVEELRVLLSASDRIITLTGNALAQSVIGSDGINVLNGGGGKDVLTGRGGADTFVFDSVPGTSNADRITDFAAEDTLQLSKSIFLALAPGAVAAGSFKNITTGTADADDRLLYKQSTGELFYDADGAGVGLKMKIAVFDNKAALTAADILVV